MARRMIAGAVASLLAAPLGAGLPCSVSEFTEAGLGYPVPIPVSTTMPGEYFRMRSSLDTRLLDLTLANDILVRQQIGTSLEGTAIYGFRLSDTDTVGPEGLPESGALVNGTIHAREWGSPEIVVQLIEQMIAAYGTDPVITYLIDRNEIVLVPVNNPDGFDQTQRYPANAYSLSRDGRMRRKNMLNVDQDLCTEDDRLLGVDLNRNFTFGWPITTNQTSLQYAGPSQLSEPESVALTNAVNLFTDVSMLRFYADVHGAIPGLFTVFNGNEEADLSTFELSQRLESVYTAINGRGLNALLYVCPVSGPCVADTLGLASDPPIGATDEYHGLTYNIPSFTIEYPVPNWRDREPGGSTFILPDDEVDEVVEENVAALLLSFLFASGPPVVESMTIFDDANGNDAVDAGEALFTRSVSFDSNPGKRVVSDNGTPLQPASEYKVLLGFNKPMRVNNGGTPEAWPGISIPPQPDVVFAPGTEDLAIQPVGSGWFAANPSRYDGDTWLGSFTVPAGSAGTTASVGIAAQDLYGFHLDEDVVTPANWDAGWQGYETNSGTHTIPNIAVEPQQAGVLDALLIY